MPFVVVLFRGEEVARRELKADTPITVGRSPECDISVRDILLSRRHCRLSPTPHGWAIEDLGSKNGTHIGGETVQYSVLKDGSSVRIGKSQLKFYSGSLSAAPPPKKPAAPRLKRPADPMEALSGTVADFVFESDQPARDVSRLPKPLPKPADPKGYSNEDVYTMLTEIASSSWDSIYATASGPAAVMVAGQERRPLPVPGAKVVAASPDMPLRRRNIVPDPSLQAIHDGPEPPSSSLDLIPRAPTKTPAPATNGIGNRWFGMRTLLRGVKRVLTGRFFRQAS